MVLALASALENEDLYNRIFHNLNMTLMRKWDKMPDDIKEDIVEKRNKYDSLSSTTFTFHDFLLEDWIIQQKQKCSSQN